MPVVPLDTHARVQSDAGVLLAAAQDSAVRLIDQVTLDEKADDPRPQGLPQSRLHSPCKVRHLKARPEELESIFSTVRGALCGIAGRRGEGNAVMPQSRRITD